MTDITRFLLASAISSAGAEWQIVGTASGDDTVNFPAGYQAGDHVLAVVSNSGASPSGWTILIAGANSRVLLLEGITNQTNLASSGAIALVVLRPVNVPTANMFGGVVLEKASVYGTGSTGFNPPSLVTTTNNNLIFALLSWPEAVSVSGYPSGYTALVSRVSSSEDRTVAMAYKTQATAGTEDPGVFTIGASPYPGETCTLSLRSEIVSGLAIFNGTFTSASADLGGQVVASNAITVSIEGGVTRPISISGGNGPEYRINGGAWVSASGTISHGDMIEVRQTSVTGANGTVTASNATLTVGTATATYSLNTRRELVVIGAAASSSGNGADTVVEWTVPAGITSVAMYATGPGGRSGTGITTYSGSTLTNQSSGGGGGGGAMATVPSQSVAGGQVLTVTAGGGTRGGTGTVGNDSTVTRSGTTLLRAKAGLNGANATATAGGSGGAGGSSTNSVGTTRQAGGAGGSGARSTSSTFLQILWGGGGGAGGYTGAGGRGSNGATSGTPSSVAGTGGAASGGSNGASGGGTGLSGAGTSGAAVTGSTGGKEGSPDNYATDGVWGQAGGISGGGGGARFTGNGGPGAVRIAW